MSKYKFLRDLERAVELYNKLHGVEAQARVIAVDRDRVVVEFRGSFCHTCGVRDWLEDLAYLLISMGYEARLTEYIEPEGEDALYRRIGIFTIRPSSQVGDYSEKSEN